MKCKSDRCKIWCRIFVLKVFVRSIWTVKGQKLSLFYSETRSFSQGFSPEAFIVYSEGSRISVRISHTNFSFFKDPPKCPLKVGVSEVRKVCQTHRFEAKAYLSSSYEVKKICPTASAQTVQFSRSRQKIGPRGLGTPHDMQEWVGKFGPTDQN